jgi:hypothetical protein
MQNGAISVQRQEKKKKPLTPSFPKQRTLRHQPPPTTTEHQSTSTGRKWNAETQNSEWFHSLTEPGKTSPFPPWLLPPCPWTHQKQAHNLHLNMQPTMLSKPMTETLILSHSTATRLLNLESAFLGWY